MLLPPRKSGFSRLGMTGTIAVGGAFHGDCASPRAPTISQDQLSGHPQCTPKRTCCSRSTTT